METKINIVSSSKILLISSLLFTNLFSANIDLQLAPENPNRVSPSKTNEILSFNTSIKSALNAVVNVSTKKHIKALATKDTPILNDPFFKRFFGEQFKKQFQQDRVLRSLGSGVIISSDGYIVTNNHVIENADEITVTLKNDPAEYQAKIIGLDKASDLAVIKIEKKDLTAIKIGSSKNLQIADLVFAIGNPFGIGETVTQGIISALNKNQVGINQYENFIQTDASINPGNSGGALVDSRGVLIGINSAILSRSGGNNGIGFAIPVSMVKDVVTKLIKDGKVTRGYLGVSIDDLSKNLMSVYNHKKGALILNIEKDSAAQKYGLKRGDLIYRINKQDIINRQSLQHIVASFKPDTKITLKIERNKSNKTITVVLGKRGVLGAANIEENILSGLEIKEINKKTIKTYNLPENLIGVLITKVKTKSKASKVGFHTGDVIIQIEDIEIKNIQNTKHAIKKYKNVPKRVYINRFGQTHVFVIK